MTTLYRYALHACVMQFYVVRKATIVLQIFNNHSIKVTSTTSSHSRDIAVYHQQAMACPSLWSNKKERKKKD